MIHGHMNHVHAHAHGGVGVGDPLRDYVGAPFDLGLIIADFHLTLPLSYS